MSAAAAAPRLGAWQWVVVPAAIGIGSRAFSVAAMVLLALLEGGVPNQFTTWDGNWYLRIVADGYHAVPIQDGKFDFAFFPAWPIVIKALTLGFLPADVVAFVASNVLFVIGAVLVWRLLADRFDATVATSATALLAFAPPAYAFSMAYSESLFLIAVAGSMLARRPVPKAALAALAAATRLAGLAVGAAAAVAGLLEPPRRRLLLAAVLGAALGFVLWFAYVAVLTGNPLGFFEGSSSWMRFNVLRTQLNSIERHPVEYLARFAFVALVLVGSALALRRDRELGTYALAIVAVAILSLISIPAQSIARYALPAFPAYAAISARLGRTGTIALLIVFAVGQVWFAGWTIGPGRVPP